MHIITMAAVILASLAVFGLVRLPRPNNLGGRLVEQACTVASLPVLQWHGQDSLSAVWTLTGNDCETFLPDVRWGLNASNSTASLFRRVRHGVRAFSATTGVARLGAGVQRMDLGQNILGFRSFAPTHMLGASAGGQVLFCGLHRQRLLRTTPTTAGHFPGRSVLPDAHAPRWPIQFSSVCSQPMLGTASHIALGPLLVRPPPPPPPPSLAAGPSPGTHHHTEEQAHRVCVGIIGDTQSNADMFSLLLHRMQHIEGWTAAGEQIAPRVACVQHRSVDLILHAGDSIQSGGAEEWVRLALRPRATQGSAHEAVPMLRVLGNHDSEGQEHYPGTRGVADRQGVVDLPRARFPADAARFLLGKSAFTCAGHVTGALRIVTVSSLADHSECLEAVLRQPLPAGVVFSLLLTHVPPWVEYWEHKAWFTKGESAEADISRLKYLPLAQKYKVHLFVAGHSHVYQRSHLSGCQPVLAIVGGGGGALEAPPPGGQVQDTGLYAVTAFRHHGVLVEVQPAVGGGAARLLWSALSPDGVVLDAFQLENANEGGGEDASLEMYEGGINNS